MSRPLYYDASGASNVINLRAMTDAELDALAHSVRVAYAAQLNAGGEGSLFVGSSGSTSIGSLRDTVSTQETEGTPSPGNQPGTSQYPPSASVNIGHDQSAALTYFRQRRTTPPSFPNAATLGTHSYLCLDGSYDIKVAKDESDIISGIINVCLDELKSGDLVGSYKVQIDSPGTNWADKGAWFIDTTYNNAANVTYKLWLRTSATSVNADVLPLKLDSNEIKRHTDISSTSGIVQNVLLPTMTRRLSTGTSLCYDVDSTISAGVSRGLYINTRFKQEVETLSIQSSPQIYFRTATPKTNGLKEEVARRYLLYLG